MIKFFSRELFELPFCLNNQDRIKNQRRLVMNYYNINKAQESIRKED